jgi:hypothetical protein
MMKLSQVSLILSFLALAVGIFIVGVSLLSANRVVSYSGTRVTCKKFYLSQEILPDHILYPIVAGFDRIILWMAPKKEKIYLRADYGRIRYRYAQGLLAKGKDDFALTTVTKSQKYYGLAAHSAIDLPHAVKLKQYVARSLAENIQKTEKMSLKFTDDKRQVVSHLNDQNKLLLETLHKQLSSD